MKIVRTVRLWFKEGTSDKVYEVDLLENDALLADQRFLVNFRYGRRGAALREGSKTPDPVSGAAAERVFESVVVAKVNDGYRRMDQPPASVPAAGAPFSDPAAVDGRGAELLARLAACLRSPWPAKDLDRLLWRIGQVRLGPAAPALIELAARRGMADVSYSHIWALARAGGAAAAPTLDAVAAQAKSALTRDLARFALVSPLMGSDRRAAGDEPDEVTLAVGRAVAAGDADALVGALGDLASRAPTQVGPALVALGRQAQGDPALHAVLASALLRLPARPPYLIGLRKLFKYAEMADDAVLFAATAHRFETARPMYAGKGGWRGRTYIRELAATVQLAEVRGAADARVGLSEATLQYFKRRIWRDLRKRGELGDPAFAEMAAAFLLSLRPEDMATRANWSAWMRGGEGQPWSRQTRSTGPFARNWTASQLLHRNARHARKRYGSLSFFEVGEPEAGASEEAFPELWTARPDLALRLAADSGCAPIALFGVRLLRAAPAFLQAADAAVLGRLLASPHIDVQRLGFEEARDRLARGAADPELLAVLIASDLTEARRLALGRIEPDLALPWSSASLGFAVLTAAYDDVDEAARRWAADRRIDTAVGAPLAARLAAWLQATPPAPDERAQAAIRTLRARMAILWAARDLPLAFDAVARLVEHPAPAVVAAGVDVLDLTGFDPAKLPDEAWRRLLGSESAEVQTAALRLFGRLDDDALLAHAPLVVAFATAPSSALRQAARPLVKRLAARDPAMADRLARDLIDTLFRTAPDDAYPADIVALLTEALSDRVAALDPGMLWRLLQARAKGAQLLGATALADRAPATFSVRQTARLGNHSHLAARRWAAAAYDAEPERFRAEAADAVLLIESDWPETQDFARTYFERWPEDAWTPATLAVVTDSVKPDLLAFARHLLRSRLAPADAAAQLTRLLEHPAQSMHLLATEMLTEAAAADEAAFSRLLPLARIVMLQVHKGRVAKDRMSAFLRAEAVRDAERAERIAPLFADLSLSGTDRDRACAILALRDIGDAHPGLATPLVRRAAREKAA